MTFGAMVAADFAATALTDLGTSITLTRTTNTLDSDWGTPNSISSSTSSATTFIKIITEKHELVKQGIAKVGDLTCIFQIGTDVKDGDTFEFNSETYRVKEKRLSAVPDDAFIRTLAVKAE